MFSGLFTAAYASALREFSGGLGSDYLTILRSRWQTTPTALAHCPSANSKHQGVGHRRAGATGASLTSKSRPGSLVYSVTLQYWGPVSSPRLIFEMLGQPKLSWHTVNQTVSTHQSLPVSPLPPHCQPVALHSVPIFGELTQGQQVSKAKNEHQGRSWGRPRG